MPDSCPASPVFPPAARAGFRVLSPLFSPTRFHEDPLFYLTSHTDEADPTKREERLRAYAEEVREGFAENPGPGEQIEPEAHDGSTW
jgi:hypothetical protein